MKRRGPLVALATIALLLLVSAAPAPAHQEQEELPLHPRLLEAKSAVIKKDVREFKEWRDFKVEMNRWGRYELLEDEDAEADLLILLTDQQFGNQWVGEEGRMADVDAGQGVTSASIGVYLVVYEADTGRMIWAEGRPRLEQGSGPKRSAAKTLVQHLKNRVEEEAEKVAEHPEEGMDE